MKTSWNGGLSSLLALGLLLSCAPDSDHLPSAPGPSITAHRAAAHWSPWSEPVNVGAPINSVGDDSQGTLSPSGLSLYFHSDRSEEHTSELQSRENLVCRLLLEKKKKKKK